MQTKQYYKTLRVIRKTRLITLQITSKVKDQIEQQKAEYSRRLIYNSFFKEKNRLSTINRLATKRLETLTCTF